MASPDFHLVIAPDAFSEMPVALEQTGRSDSVLAVLAARAPSEECAVRELAVLV